MLILDERYRVVVDSSHQNYILEKYEEVINRETKESKMVWQGIGFHGLSLRSVLNQYNKQLLADEVASANIEASQLSLKLDELEKQINRISSKFVLPNV